MTERTELLLGPQNMEKLKHCHVAVFGIGGVGGHVAEMLVRAGVGELTIIDFDRVDESNINRQIIALHSTVGQLKVDVMASRLLDINPSIKLHKIAQKYTADNRSEFFQQNYDYVVDAIDMVTSKVDLIKYCHQNDIKIVSAMGAGNRYNIPEFKVSDINKTFNDGLAKIVRKKLREEGVSHHMVVFTESKAQPIAESVGSISYYPAMCGCTLSAFVVTELIK